MCGRTYRSDVKTELVLGYTAFGEASELGPESFVAVPNDKAFSAWWLLLAAKFLVSGRIKVHPLLVREGGLGGVLEGLDLMRKDQVRSQKLVRSVSEAS